VLVLFAALALFIGLLTRSAPAAFILVAGPACISFPITNLDTLRQLTLAHWIAAWMDFSSTGFGSNFISSSNTASGSPTTAAIVLSVAFALTLAGILLVSRRDLLGPTQ
jgi:hypothetical protein